MGSRSERSGGLVYSTDSGRMCPDCRHPMAQCTCRQARPVVAGDGVVRVSREKKGRGGKTVTVLRGVTLEPTALLVLARRLKSECGSGGTVTDGAIEIQGDHVERVMQTMLAQGFTVKKVGG